MNSKSSASFVLEKKLLTSRHDDAVLEKRFFAAWKIHNQLVRHARIQLDKLKHDTVYTAALKKRQGVTDKKQVSEINRRLSSIRMNYGLSLYQFKLWVKPLQHRYKNFIDSRTAQCIADSVWCSVEKYLFSDGKEIRFSRFEDCHSIESNDNKTGIRFRNGCIVWSGLHVQIAKDTHNAYETEALTHRVKYCRIVRKPVGTRYHYYVQLILEGIPPKKHKYLESGRVGIDPGVSTEAVVSENGCILTEIAPYRKNISHKVAKLQRKMDRSRRAMNPDNYNPDGTVVTHPHRFIKSKTYKRDQMRLASLRRKNSSYVRQQEELLANRILCEHGSDVFTETMSYKGLQHRTKETAVSEKTGRIRSKKRFGGSLAAHAPARFLSILDRKLGYIGKALNKVNTITYRASQYDHDTDTYEKVTLGTRSKTISGHLVQRDLYSAFLLMCAESPDSPDREFCITEFPSFVKQHDVCISNLLNSNRKYISSFGLKDFVTT